MKRGSQLIRVGIDWRYYREKFSLESQSFNAWKINHPPTHFDLPLLGEHQIENAVTAIAVVDELRGQGFKISDEALHDGSPTCNGRGALKFSEMAKRSSWIAPTTATQCGDSFLPSTNFFQR